MQVRAKRPHLLTQIVDLKTAMEYIKDNPEVEELFLAKRVISKIRKELEALPVIKPSKRPTYSHRLETLTGFYGMKCKE